MSDWKAWCRDVEDFELDKNAVRVTLAGGRAHTVAVESMSGAWMIIGKIASAAALARLDEPELFVWQRNRTANVVGFRIDKGDRLIGEALVPAAGMDADEFRTYVRILATECDRLESLLTGVDIE